MTHAQIRTHARRLAKYHNERLDPFALRTSPVVLPPRWVDAYRRHFATHLRDGRLR